MWAEILLAIACLNVRMYFYTDRCVSSGMLLVDMVDSRDSTSCSIY